MLAIVAIIASKAITEVCGPGPEPFVYHRVAEEASKPLFQLEKGSSESIRHRGSCESQNPEFGKWIGVVFRGYLVRSCNVPSWLRCGWRVVWLPHESCLNPGAPLAYPHLTQHADKPVCTPTRVPQYIGISGLDIDQPSRRIPVFSLVLPIELPRGPWLETVAARSEAQLLTENARALSNRKVLQAQARTQQT